MRPIIRENKGSMRPGQDLVAAGFAGFAGARVIAKERTEELLGWFCQDYVMELCEEGQTPLSTDLEDWTPYGVTECEPAGEGGIYTALWTLSGAFERGIEFQIQKIPVKQSTIEVCERYDLNPYRLLSENCAVFVADNGGQFAEELKKRGIPAAVIGKVNPGIKREIYNGENGGFMERPKKDELKKVVPSYFKKNK